MTTILKRLLHIAKSYGGSLKAPGTGRFKMSGETAGDGQEDFSRFEAFHSDSPYPSAGYPEQVVQDLANFSLKPPSSLAEVKKARNREIKKYHPDRFMDHPERAATAKEILQIYNASYERLKTFFQTRSG